MILQGRSPAQEPLPYEETTNHPQHNVCDVCQLVFVTSMEWQGWFSYNLFIFKVEFPFTSEIDCYPQHLEHAVTHVSQTFLTYVMSHSKFWLAKCLPLHQCSTQPLRMEVKQ